MDQPAKHLARFSEINEFNADSLSHGKPTFKQKYLCGWRFGVLSGTVLATIVLILNIVFVIQFRSISGRDYVHPQNTIFEGSCDKAKELNIGLHLVINTLSTVLLGASNYGMQCLASPTRPELDAAHFKRLWLDIGVPSIRNITRIGRKRLLLWLLLASSSLPMHLF